MADDSTEILGLWNVFFQQSAWVYVFTSDGTVTWREPAKGGNGSGRWSLTNATLYVSWNNSTTTEVWTRPIKRSGQSGAINASYGQGAFRAEKIVNAALPGAYAPSGEIEFELDPKTGEWVSSDPRTKSDYVEKVFSAVAYGIMPDGYYVYCNGMELPIHLTENMVDFTLAEAEADLTKIYDTYEQAKAAANDSPSKRRVAFFWGAGGAVISPTLIGPATTPEIYSTIVAVRSLRDKFVEVVVPWIVMAIGMVGGPSPMKTKASPGSRISAKRGGSVPAMAKAPPPALKAPPSETEVTEASIRQAMKGATLKSQQGKVSMPMVERYVNMLKAGSTPPPIRVDDGIIVEGNHRYVAGRLMGKEPPIQPWSGGRPGNVVPWENLEIQSVDWGGK